MIFSSRPPPMILVISAEGDGEAYVRYLTTAGFRVTSASGIPTSDSISSPCLRAGLDRLTAGASTPPDPRLFDTEVLCQRSRLFNHGF